MYIERIPDDRFSLTTPPKQVEDSKQFLQTCLKCSQTLSTIAGTNSDSQLVEKFPLFCPHHAYSVQPKVRSVTNPFTNPKPTLLHTFAPCKSNTRPATRGHQTGTERSNLLLETYPHFATIMSTYNLQAGLPRTN